MNLDDEKVALPPNNWARTDRYTSTYRMITRSKSHSSDGSHLPQRSETISAEHPATADVITKRIEEANKMLEDKVLSLEVEYRPFLHSGFDGWFTGKLLPA